MTDRARPLLLVLVLLTVAAGCASASDDPAATPTTTTPTTTTPTTTAGPTTTAPTEPAEPAEPVTTRHQVDVDGVTRTYLLTVPDALPDGAVPLVVAYHGGFGSGEQLRTTSRLDEQAAARGFIVAFPDGTVDPDGEGVVTVARTWNAGRCCGPARYLEVDDLGFFDALVADVAKTNEIDREHVLVTGHSNGAMLAFRLACEHPADLAAVAAVAGSVEVVPCETDQPPSVLAIHGDADQNHPIEGGRGTRSVSGVAYRPLREGMDALAAAAGCSADPTESVEGAVTVLAWSGCDDGRSVEARIVAGADHPWPGSEPRENPAEAQGQPSQAMDATEEIVDFLLAHRG